MHSVPLNQNELEVLRLLWKLGELNPAELQAGFGWPIENATLRSVLVNLVEKGHVTRRLQGKAFYYAASVPKTTLLQGMMRLLTHVFAGGSSEALVAQLVQTGDIRPADLAVLRQTAAGKPSAKTKRKAS